MPRPWKETLHAAEPNQVLHFDFMYIRQPTATTAHQMCYVLVLLDGFSKFTELVPCAAADTITTVSALLDWFKRFGVVRQWVSDRGTHFMNSVVAELSRQLQADHQFTVAYAPWSNGQVERVNREIKEVLTAMTTELKLSADEWPSLIPAVNAVLNNSPSSAIGGYSPITAFTGRPATSPLDCVFKTDTKTLLSVPLDEPAIKRKVEALRMQLQELHVKINSKPSRKQRKRPGQQEVDFDVGDYVLVARIGQTIKDKVKPIWEGPAKVIGRNNDRSFVVEDITGDRRRDIHADHLKRFSNKDLVLTPQLKEFAVHGSTGYKVEAILGHRLETRGRRCELHVRWIGFSEDGDTWESLDRLYADVPDMVTSYVNIVQDQDVKAKMKRLIEDLRH